MKASWWYELEINWLKESVTDRQGQVASEWLIYFMSHGGMATGQDFNEWRFDGMSWSTAG